MTISPYILRSFMAQKGTTQRPSQTCVDSTPSTHVDDRNNEAMPMRTAMKIRHVLSAQQWFLLPFCKLERLVPAGLSVSISRTPVSAELYICNRRFVGTIDVKLLHFFGWEVGKKERARVRSLAWMMLLLCLHLSRIGFFSARRSAQLETATVRQTSGALPVVHVRKTARVRIGKLLNAGTRELK